MPKLWEVAYQSRQIIKYGSIALATMIVGRVIITGAVNLYRTINPPAPPAPTVGFGKLPAIVFPKSTRGELEYSLETISGIISTPSDRAMVYFMPVTRPSLLGLPRGTETAASLGFVFEPEALTERLYRYSRTTPTPSRLDYDIVTGNFKMKVDWYKKPNFLQDNYIPMEDQVLSEVRNYLNKASLLEDDISKENYLLTYLAAKGEMFREVSSLSEADFVKVDLFREEIQPGFENVTAYSDKGIIQVIISGSRTQGERVVQVQYDYFPVDIDSAESYYIKSGEEAWEELINGGGHIVSSHKEGQIVIRSSSLGYYDSFEPQNYLQPVYIFEGDDDFKAIVHAISSEWVEE